MTLIDRGEGVGITDFLTLHPFNAVTLIKSRLHARVINVKCGCNGVLIAGANRLIINPEIQYPTSGDIRVHQRPELCIPGQRHGHPGSGRAHRWRRPRRRVG